jgi:hypothetical protein
MARNPRTRKGSAGKVLEGAGGNNDTYYIVHSDTAEITTAVKANWAARITRRITTE